MASPSEHPLFIDLEDIFGDGGIGGFFSDDTASGSPNGPVPERIDHPVPDVRADVTDSTEDGSFKLDITVENTHDWDTVFLFPMHDGTGAAGGGPVSLDVGERGGTYPEDGTGSTPDYFNPGTHIVLEANEGQWRGVYFGRIDVENGNASVTPAHEVPSSYCWEQGMFWGCKIDDPVPADVKTPDDTE